MTIAEKNKEKIFEIACAGKSIAISKEGKIIECANGVCPNCIGYLKNCNNIISDYLKQEYCEFKIDELVEVSNNGTEWALRHFGDMSSNDGDYPYRVYPCGYTSKECKVKISYKYCRKYGTLGGLIKDIK